MMVSIVSGSLQRICSLESGKQKTLDNVVRLKFSADVKTQMLLDSLLAFYAIFRYGMRSEGYATEQDSWSLLLFCAMSMVAVCCPIIFSKVRKWLAHCFGEHDHHDDLFNVESDVGISGIGYDSDEEFEMKERKFVDEDMASENKEMKKKMRLSRFGGPGSLSRKSVVSSFREQYKKNMRKMTSSSSLGGSGRDMKEKMNKRFTQVLKDRTKVGDKATFWEGGMKGINTKKKREKGKRPDMETEGSWRKRASDDIEVESDTGMNFGLI